ncbi:MAG: TMEM143 family protein [Actinomycetota bacterium]
MTDRERFLAYRLDQLIDELGEVDGASGIDAEDFRAFSDIVAALYHYEFHGRARRINRLWDRLGTDPEVDQAFTSLLSGLLDGANYTAVTVAELDEALARESLIPLRLDVDLDDYDEMLIYRRNASVETVEVPTWRGLRRTERVITVDERVVVHTRVKQQAWFDEQGIDPEDRNLVPGHVSLKQFQNVPRADIEMLLPSTQVKFRRIDSLIVGVPAVASGVVVLATKLLPTLVLIGALVAAWLGLRDRPEPLDQTSLVVLFGGAVTVGGFTARQWNKLKNQKVAYLKTLSENLYFRTLADGPGVVNSLLATAEQQEVFEVLLAYRMLLASGEPMSARQLDAAVEAWIHDGSGQEVDFEVADAIAKLRRLGLVDGDRNLSPKPVPEALVLLDRRWDGLFRHRGGAGWHAMADADDGDANGEIGPLSSLRQVVDRFRGRLGGRRQERESA